MIKRFCTIATVSLIASLGLLSASPDTLPPSLVKVDLKGSPLFEDGVFSTQEGGVLSAPNVRIQAKKIRYTQRTNKQGVREEYLEAEEDLLIEYHGRLIVGSKLEYDFNSEKGTVYGGKAGFPPWFVKGERITLSPDGTYVIYNGYITTCESGREDWALKSPEIKIYKNRLMSASDIQFRFLDIPLMWVPSLDMHMDALNDMPVNARVRIGGIRGSSVKVRYRLYAKDDWKVHAALEYRSSRGAGVGIEAKYEKGNEKLLSRNFIARDDSVSDSHMRTRYRAQGLYKNKFDDGKLSTDLTYDRLSDKNMASDYADGSFKLQTAGLTQLGVSRKEDAWLLNFTTRVRINPFQTIDQKLPSLEGHIRPFQIGNTGILSSNTASVSYLDYVFAKETIRGAIKPADFNSTRLETHNRIYRPIPIGPVTLTPQAGFRGIYYSNSPTNAPAWLGFGSFGAEANTSMHKIYGDHKHVIEPYANYKYTTTPTSSVDKHYIFTIDDAYSRLGLLRVGVRNSIYQKTEDKLHQPLSVDMYAYVFEAATSKIRHIPRLYTAVEWFPIPTVSQGVTGAWNVTHHQLDHINLRTDWTINEKIAIGIEYLHRGRFSWTKADHNNFILDAVRSEQSLLNSPLSDKRDTLLTRFYYQFDPDWSVQLQTRQGWDRKEAPHYLNCKIDLYTQLYSSWKMRFSFEHTDADNRVSVSLTLSGNKGAAPPHK